MDNAYVLVQTPEHPYTGTRTVGVDSLKLYKHESSEAIRLAQHRNAGVVMVLTSFVWLLAATISSSIGIAAVTAIAFFVGATSLAEARAKRVGLING